MMDINEIGQEYNKLPQETREIIIKFIEHKTDLDMQQVITKINDFSNRIDKDMQGLNKDIQGLNKDIQSFEKSNNNLKWFIGIFGSLITIILAIIALKH